MTNASLQVVQVPEGSVLVLTGVRIEDPETLDEFSAAVAAAVGHDRFVVFYAEPDEEGGPQRVDVWGPDTDLRAKLVDLFGESGGREVVGDPLPGRVIEVNEGGDWEWRDRT